MILAEHQAGQRDFGQGEWIVIHFVWLLLNSATKFVHLAVQTILSRIPPNNSKLTYVWEEYLFHYVSEGGITYLVMADDSAGR